MPGVWKGRRAVLIHNPSVARLVEPALIADLLRCIGRIVPPKYSEEIAIGQFRAVPFVPCAGIGLNAAQRDGLLIPSRAVVAGEHEHRFSKQSSGGAGIISF